MTMLSAFMLLLSRYSGLKDVVVVHHRQSQPHGISELVGFFVNNLVLRAQVEDRHRFFDLLQDEFANPHWGP